MIGTIKAWAESEPLVTHVYLFGSRVKGTYGDHSDLDVAVRCRAASGDTDAFTTGLLERKRWKGELEELLGITVDVRTALEGDEDVRSYIQDHGILIYRDVDK